MSDIDLEIRIRARLADLRRQRQAYQQNSDLGLMGFDAAIGELEAILQPVRSVTMETPENEEPTP